ncbi:hypothetical protein HAX54_030907 [Datura stramonium]|uniref:Uncharacterized protein n=1 Tax=Datura stramonium TaxID=4076 RepID=A0ABS8VBV8_DATST|nr:hypothetical protein [Datura stramonium]
MAPTSSPPQEPHVRVPLHTAQVAKALSFTLGKRFAVAKLTARLSTRAKLRPRLLVTTGRLIPSPKIFLWPNYRLEDLAFHREDCPPNSKFFPGSVNLVDYDNSRDYK